MLASHLSVIASNANCNSAKSGSNTGEDQQHSRVVPEEVVGVIRTVVKELWDQLQQQQQSSVAASSGETPLQLGRLDPQVVSECGTLAAIVLTLGSIP